MCNSRLQQPHAITLSSPTHHQVHKKAPIYTQKTIFLPNKECLKSRSTGEEEEIKQVALCLIQIVADFLFLMDKWHSFARFSDGNRMSLIKTDTRSKLVQSRLQMGGNMEERRQLT